MDELDEKKDEQSNEFANRLSRITQMVGNCAMIRAVQINLDFEEELESNMIYGTRHQEIVDTLHKVRALMEIEIDDATNELHKLIGGR